MVGGWLAGDRNYPRCVREKPERLGTRYSRGKEQMLHETRAELPARGGGMNWTHLGLGWRGETELRKARAGSLLCLASS